MVLYLNVKKEFAVELNGLERRPSGLNIFLIVFINSKQIGVKLFCLIFFLLFRYFFCFKITCASAHVNQKRKERRNGDRKNGIMYKPQNEYIKYLLFIGSSDEHQFYSFPFCCLIFADYFIKSWEFEHLLEKFPAAQAKYNEILTSFHVFMFSSNAHRFMDDALLLNIIISYLLFFSSFFILFLYFWWQIQV